MNNQRRKEIADLRKRMESDFDNLKSNFADEISAIRDAEQEAFDNLPESLQMGDRGQAMEEAISNLEDAESELDNIDIEDALSALDSAAE